jgi:hypothetical protein
MDRCAPVICDEVHTREAHAYVMSVSLRISFFETNCRKDVTSERKSKTNGRQRRAPRTGPGGNRRCRTGHRHIFHMVRHPQRRAKSLRRHDHVCRRIARRRCPDTVNAAIRSGRATNRARFRTIDGRPRSLTAPNASLEEARPSVGAPPCYLTNQMHRLISRQMAMFSSITVAIMTLAREIPRSALARIGPASPMP